MKRQNNAILADECNDKLKSKARNINKNWVISVLVSLLVILLAVICSCNLFVVSNVSLVVSFTATILSIVLSLLAIIYSYFGNVESTRNLSEIRIAVAEIHATEESIKEHMSNISQGVNNAKNNYEFNNQMKNATNIRNQSKQEDSISNSQ